MSAALPQHLDFRDPAFLADPYPVFRQLRATAPVWQAPFGRWFLTGYEDTVLLLRDRRFGKDYYDPEALVRRFGPTAMQEPAVVELTHMMLMRDPPDHTRLRTSSPRPSPPGGSRPCGKASKSHRPPARQGHLEFPHLGGWMRSATSRSPCRCW